MIRDSLTCNACGLPGIAYVDTVYYLGGGYVPLCGWCEKVNALAWDLIVMQSPDFPFPVLAHQLGVA